MDQGVFYLVKMGNKLLIILIVALIVGGGVFLVKDSNLTGNAIGGSGSGKVQEVTLGMKNYNYYPNTIKVKQGIPVEITLDKSIGGCYRSFNIKSLGVSSYSSTPSQTIKFTPEKKGEFEFACGMRMGYGTIVVE